MSERGACVALRSRKSSRRPTGKPPKKTFSEQVRIKQVWGLRFTEGAPRVSPGREHSVGGVGLITSNVVIDGDDGWIRGFRVCERGRERDAVAAEVGHDDRVHIGVQGLARADLVLEIRVHRIEARGVQHDWLGPTLGRELAMDLILDSRPIAEPNPRLELEPGQRERPQVRVHPGGQRRPGTWQLSRRRGRLGPAPRGPSKHPTGPFRRQYLLGACAEDGDGCLHRKKGVFEAGEAVKGCLKHSKGVFEAEEQ